MMVKNIWLKGTVVLGSILFLLLGCSVVQDSNPFPVASVASNVPGAVEARLELEPQLPPPQAQLPPQVRPPLLKDKAACLDEDGIPNFDVPNLSANCPDLFAWLKFIEINAPAPENPDLALWQTWATDPNTFPEKPQPSECSDPDSDDPEQCPIWPDPSIIEAEVLLPSKRNPDLHPPEIAEAILAAAEEGAGVPSDLGHISLETIRRNRASFDYIVENELWYQEGLAQRFNENFKIEFPMDSIEIKLNWLPMKYVSDPSRYFTAEVAGELQGVVSMHVTTKDLPNWFWATFEHVDNPGRCDFIGCRDSFGLDSAYIAPRDELKTTYPPGELDPILIEIMEIEELDPVFQYYRLKGSQIDFTDSMGEPTLVGNSVTEYGFVPTASCMTCHGRAGVDWNGRQPANLRVFGEKLGGQTFNGPLDPELFYDRNNPALRYMMQVDFIWAIPFRAQPIGGNKASE